MEPGKKGLFVKDVRTARLGKVLSVDVLRGAWVQWYGAAGEAVSKSWVGWADIRPLIGRVSSTDHKTTEIKP